MPTPNEPQSVTLTQDELSQIAMALQSRAHVFQDVATMEHVRISNGHGSTERHASVKEIVEISTRALGKIERARYRGPSL